MALDNWLLLRDSSVSKVLLSSRLCGVLLYISVFLARGNLEALESSLLSTFTCEAELLFGLLSQDLLLDGGGLGCVDVY